MQVRKRAGSASGPIAPGVGSIAAASGVDSVTVTPVEPTPDRSKQKYEKRRPPLVADHHCGLPSNANALQSNANSLQRIYMQSCVLSLAFYARFVLLFSKNWAYYQNQLHGFLWPLHRWDSSVPSLH
jgi:hypothetical protein